MALSMDKIAPCSHRVVFAAPSTSECSSSFAVDVGHSSWPFGVGPVAGLSSANPTSRGKDATYLRNNFRTSCRSFSGLKKLLTDGTFLSTISKPRIGRKSTVSVYSALAPDVVKDEFDEMTETKEEVLEDLSQNPRISSTYLDKEGQTKLISVQDYLDNAPEFIRPDTGGPRWFCSVDAKGCPPDGPTLLFLPGMDSLGLGLLMHQMRLGRLFEVQCLHIPLNDRTSFVGLLHVVEQRIREEYDRKPGPIYILGESLGGCMALALAARNPTLDLVLIVANPATSFFRSQLQPLLPLVEATPDPLFRLAPWLLSFTMGNPVKMASASVDTDLPPWERIPKVAEAMAAMLPSLPVLADVMPREAVAWKIKLLGDGARYTNPRLGNIRAEVLLLVSGQDQMLPSEDEARRLLKKLPNIKARYYPNNGHTLFLEAGLDVAKVIKVAQILRHKKNRKYDPVTDFRPPFPDEVELARRESLSTLRRLYSPVFLSATESGGVRSGLPELPKGKPLLFVSNHTLVGFDLGLVVEEVLEKKGVLLRGMAHPKLGEDPEPLQENTGADTFRLFGTVPVSGNALYRVLARGEAALLYPGGVREALKKKGEQYKLFWSETVEFVRTAIRHGATIVPFASVGGDDILQIALDRDELLRIPFVRDYVLQNAQGIPMARTSGSGEVRQEEFVTPLAYPKIPPRIYYLFKQPIPTEDMLGSIKDKTVTNNLYQKVKADVESGLEYLVRKREEDPYQNLFQRVLYEITNDRQAPTFDY